ncbi:uncharacterized protein [Spinacia oleracea]|uniref:Uncharacterized protein n=1 Tax=Spinacia oleracea TaxID=3562 RepID=A0ABM3R8E0_SPIOL|nr:uncharacterized protein LOC110785018 [Spinacia oleracea]
MSLSDKILGSLFTNLVRESHRSLSFVTTTKCCGLHGINSILGDRISSINNNGTLEPATAFLERLSAQTQKLKEHLNGNSHFFQDVDLDFNLENLESGIEAALTALRKKEEDLQEAERMVMLEHAELNQAKEELERREKEIAAASSKQEKLEEELRQANMKLISQERHVKDMKFLLKEREQEIAASQSRGLLMNLLGELDEENYSLQKVTSEVFTLREELNLKNSEFEENNNVLEVKEKELVEAKLEIQHLISEQKSLLDILSNN